MKLLLVRHAQADPVGAGLARDDSDRPLDVRGRQAARDVAGKLVEAGLTFDRILTSPLMRAVQTAEIMGGAVGYAGQIESCSFLGRAGRWKDEMEGLLRELIEPASGPPASTAALVGHNPDVSDIVASLLGLHAGAVALRTGAACLLEITSPSWPARASLDWWIDPDDLRLRHRI